MLSIRFLTVGILALGLVAISCASSQEYYDEQELSRDFDRTVREDENESGDETEADLIKREDDGEEDEAELNKREDDDEASFERIVKRASAGIQTAGLNLHNKYRAQHGAKKLVLDKNLNTRAQQCANYYANKGKIDHSCPNKGKGIGENLGYSYSSSGEDPTKAVTNAITRWYNEIKNYNFANQKKSRGVTGHFTQLVWKASQRLGIGYAVKNKKSYTVALYSPQGNFNNDYSRQVGKKSG